MPPGHILPAGFFARPSDVVGPELIGKILWARGVGGGRLTEVEAYLPEDDPACHAARGLTRRNAPMFGPAGHIYVYRSYGVHILLNVVCDQAGVGSAVLIRSFEPVGDAEQLWRNRNAAGTGNDCAGPSAGETAAQRKTLTCGPGRVGQALGLRLDMSGLSLGQASGIYILDDGEPPVVRHTTRVGISQGRELPLRYCMAGSAYVSGPRRSTGGCG